MSPSPLDARALLDALRSGSPLPAFPEAAVESARALVRDLGAATPAAVEALPEPLAVAVLEAAVLDGAPSLPEALSGSSVKPLAKAAKKALYRLRSRGVAVAEAAPVAPAPRTAPTAPEDLPALASAIAGNGERAIVLGRLLRGGGVEVVQALVSDEAGVLEVHTTEYTRGNWRRLLKDAHAQGQAMELPLAEAVALLVEAAGLNPRTRTPFPPELEAALRHFGAPTTVEPPTLPPPEPDDVRRIMEGDALHETPELAAWMPPEPEVRRLLQKIDEVAVSPLALSEAQREAQLQAAVLGVARDFFTPDTRQRYALRLWRMADFFERTHRPTEADLARGNARRLFHGPQEPFSRFAEQLFEKVLGLVAATTGAAPPDQGADPGPPPRAAPTPPGERRSPGGLILP